MNDGRRILLVEDEALIAMDLEWRLRRAGYGRCRIVPTAEEAVTWFEMERHGLVIMDNHLAGDADGIEAALRIRAQSDVPIIIVSGYTRDEAFLARVRPLGPAACLDKPIVFDDLLAGLRAIAGLAAN